MRAGMYFAKRIEILLLLVVAAAARPAAADNATDNALWRPRFATPAIVALDSRSHRLFASEVRAPASAIHWSAVLSNDLRSWECELVSARFSRINRGTEPGWQLQLRVPTDISPELFTLAVDSSQGAQVQPQAVSVVPSFDTDFYILHIADEQIVNELHTDPSGQYWHMVGTCEEMKWMQMPVNLIHPRFVLITGDQIDYNGALDAWNNWSNWGYKPSGKRTFSRQETVEIENRLSELYKDCHAGYRVPYVSTPGNHDVAPADKTLAGSGTRWHPISAPIYESQFGQRSWSFRMGDFYVLLHDWTDSGLKAWAETDFRDALADRTISFRLVGQHYTTDQAIKPSSCDLMLVGHGHTNKTLKSEPYYIYEDGPAFSYGTTGFFNFRRLPNGWTCEQTASPRDGRKDVWPLFTDNGETRKVRTDQPDPNRVSTNSVTIVNDLPERFYDGRVRFLLPRGTYRRVANGKVLAQYDSADATRTAVLVKVDIPARATLTVSVGE